MSINSVSISGNLTRDAELRTTSGGTAIASFGIAVNERRKNASGEWEDYPNFVDCTMFGKRAESLQKYLVKGTKAAITGRLRYSSWEQRDGQKRSKLEVVVDDIDLMGRREDAESAPKEPYKAPAPAPAKATRPEPAQGPAAVYDEDIPF